jgi:hypothetical protein
MTVNSTGLSTAGLSAFDGTRAGSQFDSFLFASDENARFVAGVEMEADCGRSRAGAAGSVAEVLARSNAATDLKAALPITNEMKAKSCTKPFIPSIERSDNISYPRFFVSRQEASRFFFDGLYGVARVV